MKRINLTIKSIAVNNDGTAAIICEGSDYNKTGVFTQTLGQMKRMVAHTNSFTPQLLSQLVGLPGQHKFEADVELRAKGDAWTSVDGTKSGIIEKDHFAFRNESIVLSAVAKQVLFNKTAEVSITASLQANNPFATVTTSATTEVEKEEVEETIVAPAKKASKAKV